MIDAEDFINAILVILSFILFLAIPAQILFDGNKHWTPEKLELLQLTPLRPLDIVLGRLGSALGLILLTISVTAPYMALVSILPGVSLSNVLCTLVWIILLSVVLCALVIHSGWSMRTQSAGVISRVGLFFIIINLLGMPVLSLELFKELSGTSDNIFIIFAWGCGLLILVAMHFISLSVVTLRHREENKSTPKRIMSVVLLVFLFLSGVISVFADSTVNVYDFLNFRIHFMLTSILAFFHGTFLLEDDYIGKRALLDLPKSRTKRWLMLPILPGSGTGLVLLLLVLLVVSIPFEVLSWTHPKGLIFGGYLYDAIFIFCFMGWLLPKFRNMGQKYPRYQLWVLFGYLCAMPSLWFLFFYFLKDAPLPSKDLLEWLFPMLTLPSEEYNWAPTMNHLLLLLFYLCITFWMNREIFQMNIHKIFHNPIHTNEMKETKS